MLHTTDLHTWEKALARLRNRVDEESFATWLEPTRLHLLENQKITLSVPNPFIKNWLSSNYREKILGALREVTEQEFDLDFTIRPAEESESDQLSGSGSAAAIAAELGMAPDAGSAVQGPVVDTSRSSTLNPKYTFDLFVVGESNRFAHAACRQVADPHSRSYNPLFLYGGVGLGKTHLMHAIGHQLLAANASARVLYVSSEQFMNSFIESISQGKQIEFRDYFRNVDLLMIDDVQFFAGKERTQTEFFHTFNALYDAGKKIVISSDRSPKELTTLEDRLRNRFSWGLVVDVMPPDLETRIAILKRKAGLEGLDLPADVTLYIAERVVSNIRELEGVMTRLKAYSQLHREPVSLQMAKSVLGHLLEQEPPKAIDLDEIIDAVCGYFELKRSDLTGTSRLKKFATPRHIAQYLARKLTPLSYPEIAQKFGGRDHTSVLHAVKKIEEACGKDENMKNLIAYLTKKIRGTRGPE